MISQEPLSHRFFPSYTSGIHLHLLKYLCFLLILEAGSVSTANAQVYRLEVGDRVRITAPFVDPMERIEGTLSEMSGSVLVLSSKDSLFYISDSMIQQLEVSTGKKRVVGRGALIGAVTGTMVFGTIAAISNDLCGKAGRNCALARSNGAAFVSGGRTGLLSGIVAGAITGFFIRIDDWERAPARLAISAVPEKMNTDKWSVRPNISFRINFGD